VKICQQFISKNKDIILTLLNPADAEFVICSAKQIDLEYLFSVPAKSASMLDVVKEEMSWTYCYLISDQTSNYGLIKVVPEMDGILSFHGIGWSKNFSFSRKYFNAWWLIHDLYFNTHLISKSNSLLTNHRAIKVLINTGYNPDFIIQLDSNTYKVGYHLTKVNFYKNASSYLSHNSLVENKKLLAVASHVVNKEKYQTRIESSVKSVLLQSVNSLFFKSKELANRVTLDVQKNFFILSFKSVKIKILELFFEHNNQYHLETNEDARLYDLLIIKLYLRDFFNTRNRGEVFVYPSFYPILFTNDYLFVGEDPVTKSTLFKIDIQ